MKRPTEAEIDVALDTLLASQGRLRAAIDKLRARYKAAIEAEILAGEKSFDQIAHDFAVSHMYIYRVNDSLLNRREKDAAKPEASND